MTDFHISKDINNKYIEGIVNVQKKAWNMSDIGAVPNFEIRAVSDVGFVYVAIDTNDTVIGFIYGYHHFPNIHYSHMMATLPEWQGKGVGYELKKFHYQQALKSEHHIEAVKWTVDPLLPNNAYLNFAKLGCYCDDYKINYYGDPESDGVGIYAGIPTDRFKVTWPIHTNKVKQRMENYKAEKITKDAVLTRSPAINTIENTTFKKIDTTYEQSFTVQMPSDFQVIRRNSINTALEWRLKFREICVSSFQAGYHVEDYHSFVEDNQRINFYEFSKQKHN